MAPHSDSSAAPATGVTSSVDAARTPISRPSSRRSLKASDSASHNPLFAPAAEPAGAGGAGQYAVYSPGKKRATVSGSSGFPSTTVSTSSPLSPSDGPLSASSTSSAAPSPPFVPTTSPFLPPLVSRPSNSTLPSPSGRQYARSVSEAKEQLQKQAIKAELQSLGLSSESAGSALVNKLANLGDEAELKGLQAVLAGGKVTMILPAEKLDATSQLTSGFLLDHLILLDAPSSTSTSAHLAVERGFATLSGLRGVLTGGELVFTSAGGLAVDGRPADLSDDEVLRSLRGVTPLPAPPPATHYPSNALISAITTLSIAPSRSATPTAASNRTTTTSRLAALFAKTSAATPPPEPTSPNLPPVVQAPAGSLSANSLADAAGDDSAALKLGSIDVPVLAVNNIIRRTSILDGLSSACRAHLRKSSKTIDGIDGESDVLGPLTDFAAKLGPQAKSSVGANAGGASGKASTAPAATASVSLFGADPADLSDEYQDVMHEARLSLTRNLGSSPDPSAGADSDATAIPSLEDFSQLEERVDASLEKLEDIVTSLLYDRLFAPPASRDLQEDENLASRIAALNVLELGLDHLGLELEDEDGLEGWEQQSRSARESLEDLAAAVGKQLNRLEDAHECVPSAKLAILVECHKVLVDGLSKLPPVPLKKELSDDKSSLSDQPAEVEMDDASSRSNSLPPSRPLSPPQGKATSGVDDELLKTPRAPLPGANRDVPEIKLPAPGRSDDLLEATSSSLFDLAAATPSSPLTSIFETKRRAPSTSSTAASSSADLILPLLIYSVVRANPPHLVSHLRFIQRFRSESLARGQSSFCATNFDAVVEFLNHVDMSSLGLSSQKVLSAAPSPSLAPSASSPPLSRPRAHTTQSLLRSRVSSTADSLVGTANSALTGVVDSSYRMLFGPKGISAAAPRSLDDVKSVLDGARGRARDSLPFRRSTSSRSIEVIAGLGARGRAGRAATLALDGDEKTAPPLTVLREGVDPDKDEESPDITPTVPNGTFSAGAPPPPLPPRASASAAKDDSDARSVRSVSSFLNFRESTLGRALGEVRDGVVGAATGAASAATGAAGGSSGEGTGSLGGRLAGLPVLHRFGGGSAAAATPAAAPPANTSPTSSRRSTLLNPLHGVLPSTWSGATPSKAFRPTERFTSLSSASELKLGEVQELLDEYKKLVAALQGAQAGHGAAVEGETREAVAEGQ